MGWRARQRIVTPQTLHKRVENTLSDDVLRLIQPKRSGFECVGDLPQKLSFGPVQDVRVVKFDDHFGLDVKNPVSHDRRKNDWIISLRAPGLHNAAAIISE